MYMCPIVKLTRISIYSPSNQLLSKFGGYGISPGKFFHPSGIAINSSGYVYVTDFSRNNVQIFGRTGNFVYQWSFIFTHPDGIAINGSNYVYVVDNGVNTIRVFSPTGTQINHWGGSGTDNGLFNSPWGIAINSSGYVYVADYNNGLIQSFNSVGIFAGNFSAIAPSYLAVNSSDVIFAGSDVYSNPNNLNLYSDNGTLLKQFSAIIDSEYNTIDGPIMGVAINSTWRCLCCMSRNVSSLRLRP